MRGFVSLLLKEFRKAVFCPIDTMTRLSHEGTLATLTVSRA